jgi:hypothetical protein
LQLRRGGLRPILGLSGSRGDGAGGLGNVRHIVRGQRTEGTGKTGLIFIDPKFVLRQTLRTPHYSRRPHQPHWGLMGSAPKGGILLRPCPTPGLIRLLRSHCSSTAQLRSRITYSGHGCADIPPLSTTLGLVPTQSLLHLTVYPALT